MSPSPTLALVRRVAGLLAAACLALAAQAQVQTQTNPNFEYGIDRPGGDYRSFDLSFDAPGLCAGQCAQEGQCRAWTYVRPGIQGPSARCWLKTSVPAPIRNAATISGLRGGTAQPPAPVPAPVPAASFIGCFKDTSVFDLDGHLERSAQNTPQRCAATCRARGFAFAAVQYGESCLCGNSFGRYGAANNCNYACTGDRGQVCGGYNANSVYATGLAPGPAPVAPVPQPPAPPITQPPPPPVSNAAVKGMWNWQANCPEGAYSGDFGIGDLAADGGFSGGFANGNGSLQGRIQGNRITFVRTLFDLRQHWTAAVVADNRMEQGSIQRPTEQKSNCSFMATRTR